MIFFQGGKDLFHDGFTHEGGAGVDAEAGAVLFNGGKLAVIEIEDMAVLAKEHLFLLLKVFRIYSRYLLLSAGHNDTITVRNGAALCLSCQVQ